MAGGFVLQCGNCGRENIIPVEKVLERPRCSACPSLLIPANCLPGVVGDKNWAEEVEKSPVPVVAYFWGPNCGVCANYVLSVRKMAASLYPKARVVTINAEEEPATPKRYDLKGVPTLMIFHSGELRKTLIGPQGERTVREALMSL